MTGLIIGVYVVVPLAAMAVLLHLERRLQRRRDRLADERRRRRLIRERMGSYARTDEPIASWPTVTRGGMPTTRSRLIVTGPTELWIAPLGTPPEIHPPASPWRLIGKTRPYPTPQQED